MPPGPPLTPPFPPCPAPFLSPPRARSGRKKASLLYGVTYIIRRVHAPLPPPLLPRPSLHGVSYSIRPPSMGLPRLCDGGLPAGIRLLLTPRGPRIKWQASGMGQRGEALA